MLKLKKIFSIIYFKIKVNLIIFIIRLISFLVQLIKPNFVNKYLTKVKACSFLTILCMQTFQLHLNRKHLKQFKHKSKMRIVVILKYSIKTKLST
jgi:positive regulator of sigma E activity